MGVYARKGKRATTYSIDFYVNGVRKRVAGFKTRTEAQKALEAVRTDARRGLLNIAAPESSPGFQDFAEEYFQWQRGRKRSWERDQVILKHMVRFFGNRPLSQITPGDVEAYKAARLSNGKAKGTIDRELAVLRHLFNMAIKWKRHNENPVLPETFSHEKNNRWHILTRHEEARLLEAAEPFLKPVLLFALQTGFRRGQVLALKWEYLDLLKKRVFLPAEINKSKKDHTLPLGTTAIRVLRSLSRDTKYCFGELNPYQVYPAFKRALKAAGLPETIRFHDLRHTFITRLAEAGAPLDRVRRLAQHSSLVITQGYTHSHEDGMRESLELLEPSEKIVTNGHKFSPVPPSLDEKSLIQPHNQCSVLLESW